MKVTRYGVTDLKSEEENGFYAILKQVLKKVFEVNVGELPTILTTLGIKVPVKVKEYCYNYNAHDTKMKFETGETVVFHRGNMLSPYPYITCNGEDWILIGKDKKVDTLEKFEND